MHHDVTLFAKKNSNKNKMSPKQACSWEGSAFPTGNRIETMPPPPPPPIPNQNLLLPILGKA